MSDSIIVPAVGAVAAAEVMGVTNFVGSGSSDSGGGFERGGGGVITVPSLGGVGDQLADIRAALADAQAAAQAGTDTIQTIREIRETVTQVPVRIPGTGDGDGDFEFEGTPSLLDMTNPNLTGFDTGDGPPNWSQTPGSPGGTEHTLNESEFGIVRDADAAVRGVTDFVGDNPYATAGMAAGLALAPVTGGTSALAAVGAGGASEIGADVITGQYGDVGEAVGTAGNQAAGVADSLAGSTDEAFARQFDDKPGGGFADIGPIFGGGGGGSSSSSESNRDRKRDGTGDTAKSGGGSSGGAWYSGPDPFNLGPASKDRSGGSGGRDTGPRPKDARSPTVRNERAQGGETPSDKEGGGGWKWTGF